MLALIYLAVAVWLGDRLCRSFYRFVSVPHRWAAAVLVGLLFSSWFTYLAGLAFAHTSKPLLWADLLFFAVAAAAISVLNRRSSRRSKPDMAFIQPRAAGSETWDWITMALYGVLVSWMMFASLNSSADKLLIANNEYSDFGPNTAIMQSFAVGHNFPTEYPHFSGDRIRYHFLFYFQAGNLEFLGLDPAWSLNLLSIITLVAMLVLVMVLGEVLFNSRAVGRLGSALFFFFGSLSYIPFLHKQGSVRAALHAILHQREFLPSIFPYRGELWGTWSQVTYLNQRHFASAIGLLLLVLIFLVLRYRAASARQIASRSSAHPGTPEPSVPREISNPAAYGDLSQPESFSAPAGETPPFPTASADEMPARPVTAEPSASRALPAETFRATVPGFIFSGVLLGLVPMWNSAVFIVAFPVLALLLILCPLRPQMLMLAITAGALALPQILYLSTGSGRAPTPKLIHWGYTIDHPTVWNAANYLGFTFGFKWLLVALALVFATGLQRRIFVAISSLILVAFCFQFTIEVLANQKFLHIWLIIANLFVAYGLWRLWRLKLGPTTLPGKLAALVFVIVIIAGGVIDFFPIHNATWAQVTYRNDPLIDWLTKETKPRDIFLTDRFVTHPILMAGRRVFYGWPYYGWSAGYDASKRDRVYIDLFANKNPWKVFRLLKENGISYVAFDNAVRQAQFIKRPNEQIYAAYFPKVFEDNRINGLTIYKVPETPPPQLSSLPEGVTNMFEGGRGTDKGQFDSPTAVAVDPNGNIFVADTNNGRIEKFSPNGMFVTTIGTKGSGHGQLGEPNGIVIDRAGNIYVAEVASNHRVQKLAPDGTFIAEWKGPEPGFYGPRRITIGPDDSIYVVDSGHNRIVKFNPDGQVLASWGSEGSGDGQFKGLSSVAVDPMNNKLYVADPLNSRIQVFDSNGKFLTKWSIPEWGQTLGFEDLAVDSQTGRLYASSAHMNSVLVFDLTGARIGALKAKPPDRLDGPSALALVNRKLYVLNMHGNRVSPIDL
jgi:DNA-binding beta-propeller fold protein YncE